MVASIYVVQPSRIAFGLRSSASRVRFPARDPVSLSIMNFILQWQKLLILLLVFGATVLGLNIMNTRQGGLSLAKLTPSPTALGVAQLVAVPSLAANFE
jgi:hypothetical protein